MEIIKRNELPETCFSTLPGMGDLIILKRGETGYYPCDWETGDRRRNKEIADLHNDASGINAAQVGAMQIGSMCGFQAPGADPQVFFDKAKLVDTLHADGIIKDPVISMFTPAKGNLYQYELAGTKAYYIDLSAIPEAMMSRWSSSIMLPDLVQGKPLVPVAAKWDARSKCTLTLESGCCVHEKEINAGYQVIAKVGVGPVEYALAEIKNAKHPFFATWERTPGNDADGKPNYYWGHYLDNRQQAIEDFCRRASEKYEMLSEQRKPSIRAQLAAARPEQEERPSNRHRDRDAR